jgi:molybdopterin biosynthesis enzyme MoaB
MLSRAVSGVRNHTLIINMPGSEAAVRESFEIVRPVLAHAVELLREQVVDCGRPVEE